MGRISMPQGKGSQMHNRRDYEKIGRAIPDNINSKLTFENVILVDKEIRTAYQEIFGDVLQEYNSKQKRADRKIADYYEHIMKSKNGEKPFYEDVLQWGRMEDFKAEPQLREKAKECLVEYARNFESRNPNLKLIGAYVHMDEASPHLHLDYIPVAQGYKRGLQTRNSLDKAMKQMGYIPEKESRQNNATKLWKEHERDFFAELCRSRGLEVEAERKARGSLSVAEYAAAKEKMIQDVKAEVQPVIEKYSKQKDEALEEVNRLQQRSEELTQSINISEGLNTWYEDENERLGSENEDLQDKNNELEEKHSQLKEKISNVEQELDSKSEVLDQQAEQIERIDAVTKILAQTDAKDNVVENLVIPEKKSILGRVETPERHGAFIEGMDSEQVKILMRRVKVEDSLQKVYDDVIQRAEKDAKVIRVSATKEKNEIVAKAQSVLDERDGIIQRAKDWAKSYKDKYNDLVEKFNDLAHRFNDLVGKYNRVKGEIDRLEASRGDLEPLRKEVEELTRAKQIMSGELDYELTRAKFKPWSEMPFGADYSSYRKRGELLALYKDGTTRLVGSNPNGGFDYKTLDDEKNGLCRVGIMVDEERVQVPKSLLKELMQARDREKPISQSLQNLILQQTEVDRTVQRHRGVSR